VGKFLSDTFRKRRTQSKEEILLNHTAETAGTTVSSVQQSFVLIVFLNNKMDW